MTYDEIAAQLVERGDPELANRVKLAGLAASIREAGHDDLAEALISASKPAKISAKDPLTKAQWQSVVNAMANEYANSSAMMIDDLMRGFEKKAKQYGLGTYFDGAVFSFLALKASRNQNLTAADVQELNKLKISDA